MRQILSHRFSKCCYKNPFTQCGSVIYFRQQVVHLILCGLNGNNRVKKACRSDNLLNNLRTVFSFKLTGGGRSEYYLIYFFIKFIKSKRSVIERTRQSKAIFDKAFLSCSIPCIHTPNLWKHNMAFIAKKKKIIRHIIYQGKRRLPRLSTAHNSRIVFNALAKTRFPEHFNIIHCSLFNSLCFKKLTL